MAELQDSESKSCVLFSTADWHEPYWTNKQHTARTLAALGWKVVYVESVGIRAPKVGSQRDLKRLYRRLITGLANLAFGPKPDGESIWVLSPLVVPMKRHWPLVRWLNRHLLRLSVLKAIKKAGMIEPLIWTYHPYMLDAIDHVPVEAVVYHCVDDVSTVPGVDANHFLRAEEILLRHCDAVFVTAQPLAERCAQFNENTLYLGNVVDDAHFGKALMSGPIPPEISEIPEPRLVYHGVLSDFKIDFALILEVARKRSDWHWVLIGQEREGQRSIWVKQLTALPNVHFLGYRSYHDLPTYLRGMQVGLLPTLLNDYTRSMFPMKYFEYLAAGLPVVSTRIAFTNDESKGILVADNAEEFAAAIQEQLSRGRLSPRESFEYVGDNTWRGRTTKMLNYLRSVRNQR